MGFSHSIPELIVCVGCGHVIHWHVFLNYLFHRHLGRLLFVLLDKPTCCLRELALLEPCVRLHASG